jgi:hypothetical protein
LLEKWRYKTGSVTPGGASDLLGRGVLIAQGDEELLRVVEYLPLTFRATQADGPLASDAALRKQDVHFSVLYFPDGNSCEGGSKTQY